jgi:hypothetical protein
MATNQPNLIQYSLNKLNNFISGAKANLKAGASNVGAAAQYAWNNLSEASKHPLQSTYKAVSDTAYNLPYVRKNYQDYPASNPLANFGVNFSTNLGQTFFSGISDVAKPIKINNPLDALQVTAQKAYGAGKMITPFINPVFDVANSVASLPGQTPLADTPRRLASGFMQGQTGIPNLANNVPDVKTKLPLLGEVDLAKAAGSMAGFTQNPINKAMFGKTTGINSLQVVKGRLANYLVTRGAKGSLEGFFMGLAGMPDKDRAKYLGGEIIKGLASEVIMDKPTELANKAVSKGLSTIGKSKAYQQAVKSLDDVIAKNKREIQLWNIKMNDGYSGEMKPLWKIEIEQRLDDILEVIRKQDGFIRIPGLKDATDEAPVTVKRGSKVVGTATDGAFVSADTPELKAKPRINLREEQGNLRIITDAMEQNTTSPFVAGKGNKVVGKMQDGSFVAADTPELKANPKINTKTEQKAVSDLTKVMEKNTKSPYDEMVATDKPWYRKVFESTTQSIQGVLKRSGKSGKQIAGLLDKAEEQGALLSGQQSNTLRKAITKLSPDEMKQFADVVEGRATADTPALEQAVTTWKSIAEDIRARATEAGIEMGNIQDYFPHFIPEAAQGGKGKAKYLQALVDKGFAPTVEAAQQRLDSIARKAAARRFGLLEKSREATANLDDLPIYETDPRKVLFSYIENANRRIADAVHFGTNDEILYNLAHQAGFEGGDETQLVTYLNRVLGKEASQNQEVKAISQGIRSVQSVKKLGFGTAFTNITQNLSTAIRTDIPTTIKTIVENIQNPAKSLELAYKTGEIDEQAFKELNADIGSGTNLVQKWLRIIGMQKTERFNRIIATNAGANYAEKLAKQLTENPGNKSAISELKRLGLDPEVILKNGLSEMDILKAARNVSGDTQFSTTPKELPYYWTGAIGKIVTQFRSFAYKQTGFIAETSKRVASEAITNGNFKPLINLLIVYGVAAPIVGEIVADAKSFIQNRSRGDMNATQRYLSNILEATSFGLLDELPALTGEYGLPGTAGAIAGPTASDAIKYADALQQLNVDRKGTRGWDEFIARTKKLRRQALRDVPGLGSALANTLVSNENVDNALPIGINQNNQKTPIGQAKPNTAYASGTGSTPDANGVTLPDNDAAKKILYDKAVDTYKNYQTKKTEILYSKEYNYEEERAEALAKLDKDFANAVDTMRATRDSGQTDTLNVKDILDMPENTAMERVSKSQEAYKKAAELIGELYYPKDKVLAPNQTEVEAALQKIGITPENASYYYFANQSDAEKIALVDETISTLKDRGEVFKYLANGRKEINGKFIVSSGVITHLEDTGVLSKEEAKQLRDFRLGEDGKANVKVSGRGSGAKIKKISIAKASGGAKIKTAKLKKLTGLKASTSSNAPSRVTPKVAVLNPNNYKVNPTIRSPKFNI